ncbi:MAG: methyltransferase domain-containing protein [Prevotellaceae bacterium]|jgi:2-polyprenyl-3-methyl-5-hydroxy-6-metoxy-1,4-benzoquinol methylase|nr:methyltransferase domain-containing protein [Prevotellaceae bacterium]
MQETRQKIFNFINKACNYLPTRKIPRLTRKYTARILGIKDFSLNSGERQTAKSLDGMRADHTARYQISINFLKKHYADKEIYGYDVFCGVGYGSYMLSKEMHNANIKAIDGSTDAIKLAEENYQTGKIIFSQKFFPFELPEESADFFISLESIEHIENDTLFLETIRKTLKINAILIISTPNVYEFKLKTNANHFHYRHYKPKEFIMRLTTLGFELLHLYGQNTYRMNKKGKITSVLSDSEMTTIKENYEGQNCVYIFKKIK